MSSSENTMKNLIEKTWPRWKVTKLLGEGSYGCVFEAHRSDIGGDYGAAIKVVGIPKTEKDFYSAMQEGMDEVSATSYFKNIVEVMVREFALMDKLKGNTNIVAYEDHEVIARENGLGWDILIRMELLSPLNEYNMKHPLDEKAVIKLGMDISKALAVCEKFNIVHRDIKPENIFVSELGDYKIGDFGVARTAEQATSGMSVRGTYAYMAPEVYKGQEYNLTVDIYSLGIMLYRLLNYNRAPFVPLPPNPITLSDKERSDNLRLNGTPFPPAAQASPEMMAVINKAIAFQPKERYQHAEEMYHDLEQIAVGKGKKPSMEKEQASVNPQIEQQENVSNAEVESRIAVTPAADIEMTVTDDSVREPKRQKAVKTVAPGAGEGLKRVLFSSYLLALFFSLDFYENMILVARRSAGIPRIVNAAMLLFLFLTFAKTPFVLSWKTNYNMHLGEDKARYGRLFLVGLLQTIIFAVLQIISTLSITAFIPGLEEAWLNLVAEKQCLYLVAIFMVVFFAQLLWLEGCRKSAVLPAIVLGAVFFVQSVTAPWVYYNPGYSELICMLITTLVYFFLAFFQLPGFITRYFLRKPQPFEEEENAKKFFRKWNANNGLAYAFIVILFFTALGTMAAESWQEIRRGAIQMVYLSAAGWLLMYWFTMECNRQKQIGCMSSKKWLVSLMVGLSVIAAGAELFTFVVLESLGSRAVQSVTIYFWSVIVAVTTLLTEILINSKLPKFFRVLNLISVCFFTWSVLLQVTMLTVGTGVWCVVLLISFIMLKDKKALKQAEK